jgi:hypothetical protein
MGTQYSKISAINQHANAHSTDAVNSKASATSLEIYMMMGAGYQTGNSKESTVRQRLWKYARTNGTPGTSMFRAAVLLSI